LDNNLCCHLITASVDTPTMMFSKIFKQRGGRDLETAPGAPLAMEEMRFLPIDPTIPTMARVRHPPSPRRGPSDAVDRARPTPDEAHTRRRCAPSRCVKLVGAAAFFTLISAIISNSLSGIAVFIGDSQVGYYLDAPNGYYGAGLHWHSATLTSNTFKLVDVGALDARGERATSDMYLWNLQGLTLDGRFFAVRSATVVYRVANVSTFVDALRKYRGIEAEVFRDFRHYVSEKLVEAIASHVADSVERLTIVRPSAVPLDIDVGLAIAKNISLSGVTVSGLYRPYPRLPPNATTLGVARTTIGRQASATQSIGAAKSPATTSASATRAIETTITRPLTKSTARARTTKPPRTTLPPRTSSSSSPQDEPLPTPISVVSADHRVGMSYTLFNIGGGASIPTKIKKTTIRPEGSRGMIPSRPKWSSTATTVVDDAQSTVDDAQSTVADTLTATVVADAQSTVADTLTATVVDDALPATVVADAQSTVDDALPATVIADAQSTVADALSVIADATTVDDDALPTIADALPMVDDALPTIADATTVVADALPVVDDATTVVDDALPTIDYVTTVVDDALPVVDDALPTIDTNYQVDNL
jgi:hypothetical protein